MLDCAKSVQAGCCAPLIGCANGSARTGTGLNPLHTPRTWRRIEPVTTIVEVPTTNLSAVGLIAGSSIRLIDCFALPGLLGRIWPAIRPAIAELVPIRVAHRGPCGT